MAVACQRWLDSDGLSATWPDGDSQSVTWLDGDNQSATTCLQWLISLPCSLPRKSCLAQLGEVAIKERDHDSKTSFIAKIQTDKN